MSVLHRLRRRRRRVVREPAYDLALLTSGVLLFALVLTWLYLLKDEPAGEAAVSLVLAVLPNFAALLIAFIVAATILERRGVSPQQQLRRSLVHDIVVNVKPVPGVRALHPFVQSTPYGSTFAVSERLEMVGRWYNETLSRCTMEVGQFLDAGGVMTVVLTDPTDDVLMRQAAQQYLGRMDPSRADVEQVRFKTLDTVNILERLCRDEAGRSGAQIAIYLTRLPLNAWGIRSVSRSLGDSLFFASYDHVRAQTSSCPTVVFDLDQSPETKAYWSRDLTGLVDRSVPLDEWRLDAARSFVSSGGALDSCSGVVLRGDLLQQAMREAGLSVTHRLDTAHGGQVLTWTGSGQEWRVQVNAENCVDAVDVTARPAP